ncbi:LOW QUALITY PROTEIN: CBY1-interacting BAR domain-containing protein 1-like [Penaeus chinensis]|uniref:LOW QUALITY PROTEIN: CBY1-interacting BAR domain-containing protein 1-like n=1 Tax=Penaeus chinensis TaxID=139456 RepID=UPI001FB6A0F0|nr:LOW QUALITY PROTEIN: CBY1-interacting BAR domain-containing protein 1-like [Penaeus chinensis]
MFSSSSDNLSKVHTNQTKFMQERIAGVEKHFGQICTSLGAYTRKTARLRDKGDEVSTALLRYGEVENLNKSLRSSLCETADTLAAVQDFRNVEVERLESRVVGELALYEGGCKSAREELKRSFNTRQQEMNHRRNLERAKSRHPQNRQQIAIAETKLQKATVEAKRAVRNIEEQMDQFEQRKVTDLKRILKEFIQTELAFHAKAVELYTKAYNQISNIEEEEDLEEFRNALKGDAAARAEVLGVGRGSSLSPVIKGPREKTDSSKKRDPKKMMEKLKIEDYEEINGDTSEED